MQVRTLIEPMSEMGTYFEKIVNNLLKKYDLSLSIDYREGDELELKHKGNSLQTVNSLLIQKDDKDGFIYRRCKTFLDEETDTFITVDIRSFRKDEYGVSVVFTDSKGNEKSSYRRVKYPSFKYSTKGYEAEKEQEVENTPRVNEWFTDNKVLEKTNSTLKPTGLNVRIGEDGSIDLYNRDVKLNVTRSTILYSDYKGKRNRSVRKTFKSSSYGLIEVKIEYSDKPELEVTIKNHYNLSVCTRYPIDYETNSHRNTAESSIHSDGSDSFRLETDRSYIRIPERKMEYDYTVIPPKGIRKALIIGSIGEILYITLDGIYYSVFNETKKHYSYRKISTKGLDDIKDKAFTAIDILKEADGVFLKELSHLGIMMIKGQVDCLVESYRNKERLVERFDEDIEDAAKEAKKRVADIDAEHERQLVKSNRLQGDVLKANSMARGKFGLNNEIVG